VISNLDRRTLKNSFQGWSRVGWKLRDGKWGILPPIGRMDPPNGITT
jgi:hypothetical protein